VELKERPMRLGVPASSAQLEHLQAFGCVVLVSQQSLAELSHCRVVAYSNSIGKSTHGKSQS
jgi:hypothetical protein